MPRGGSLIAALSWPAIVLSFLALSAAHAQEKQSKSPFALPSILRVQLDSTATVKSGVRVRAHTVEPLYRSDRVTIPEGTVVLGRIASVMPVSRMQRVSAMARGDFTPLREAQIQFDRLQQPNGLPVAISAAPAQEGSAVVHFRRAGASHPSVFHRLWRAITGKKNQAVSRVTAPGKIHRLERFAFWQLPWHPQWIEAGSQYDVTLSKLPTQVVASAQPGPEQGRGENSLQETATLHTRLTEELSSRTARQDQMVAAVVTCPFYDAGGNIEVPQGSVLQGRVLRARPAKKWGRNGALRFTFSRVDFPQGVRQEISGVPSGVDGAKNGNLRLDAEGGVEPSTAPRLLTPLALGVLATGTLTDEDASLGRNAAASNGFGLIARLVAVTSGSRLMGGVIGLITAGRSVYSHFIARGRDVTFPRNSEVEIDAAPIPTSKPDRATAAR